jgi:hypothetical protein
MIGCLLAFLGTTSLVLYLRVRGKMRFVAVYSILVVALVTSREAGFSVLLRTYAAGFKKAAFCAAMPAEWSSLLPVAGTWLSATRKGSFDRMLPSFSRRVYPHLQPYSGVSGDFTSDLSNLSVTIWWRDPTLCVGLEIGKAGQLTGELYRQEITNRLSLVVFRGG